MGEHMFDSYFYSVHASWETLRSWQDPGSRSYATVQPSERSDARLQCATNRQHWTFRSARDLVSHGSTKVRSEMIPLANSHSDQIALVAVRNGKNLRSDLTAAHYILRPALRAQLGRKHSPHISLQGLRHFAPVGISSALRGKHV